MTETLNNICIISNIIPYLNLSLYDLVKLSEISKFWEESIFFYSEDIWLKCIPNRIFYENKNLNYVSLHNNIIEGNHIRIKHLLMLKLNIDLNTRDKYGWTFLHFAAENGDFISVKLLLEYGANPNIKTLSGELPIDKAGKNCHLNIVNLLLNYNESNRLWKLSLCIREEKKLKRNILHQEACNGNINNLKTLLSNKYAYDKINSKDIYRWTPLHCAVNNNNYDTTELLLDNNAKINIPTQTGDYPIHKAAKNGNVSIVKLLLERNSAIDKKNKQRKTPLDLAIENGNNEVVKLLQNYKKRKI